MKRFLEKLMMVFVTGFMFTMVGFSVILMDAVQNYERPVFDGSMRSPPEIPQCDKPLWDRIRYLCDE